VLGVLLAIYSKPAPGFHRIMVRSYVPGCIIATANDKFQTMVPPNVTIYVPGPLRRYCAGAAQLSISAHTVRAALEDLQRSQSAFYRNVCDETGTLRRHLNVFVNSDNVRDLDGVDTKLTPGDVVTILPAVSGG
jgi:sulfur-carrier protein